MDVVIDQLQRQCAAREGTLLLGGGLPAEELFPQTALKEAFDRALRASALQYGWPEGTSHLRAWIAKRLRDRGVALDADDVIVTAGAQQGLAIATELLLGEGTSVAVDSESYPAALSLFRERGARPSCALTDAAFVYTMPAIANPRGNAMSAARRAALLACGRPLVEDDAYAELAFDGGLSRPLVADARDRVWHVGTLSKTLCPGLRIGWLVPPRSRLQRALSVKHTQDLQAGTLTQAIVVELLARFDYDAHLVRARRLYWERAEVLMEAVRRSFPAWTFDVPLGGFSIFVDTGEPIDDVHFLAKAASFGVAFDPGRLFRVDDSARSLALRLCYSTIPPGRLRESVARLARAWTERGAGRAVGTTAPDRASPRSGPA